MTLQEFRDFILRKLGLPFHNVELSEDQIYDCITEAVDRFTERHYDSTIEGLYALNLTVGQNKYSLPSKIKSVLNLFPGNSMFSNIDNAERMLLPVQGQPFFDYLFKYPDVSTISLLRLNTKMWEDTITNQNIQFDYNAAMNVLTIHGDILRIITSSLNNSKVFLLVEEREDDTTVYNNRWLKQYAVALCKRQWAMNLKKFNAAPLPGGAELNHEGILSDANDEIQRLEEQLDDEFNLPPSFFIS